jgi:hypothetical protein
MAQGVPLPGTEGADEEHTLVHIQFTQTSDFEKLSDQLSSKSSRITSCKSMTKTQPLVVQLTF